MLYVILCYSELIVNVCFCVCAAKTVFIVLDNVNVLDRYNYLSIYKIIKTILMDSWLRHYSFQ